MADPSTEPQVAALLDFISIAESGGNYNAVIGNAHASDDLGAKTIDEIYMLQHQLIARGEPSSAVGRYQFIGPTLHSLVSQSMLATSILFTPAVQDRFALLLLRARGFEQWKAGQINDAEFAHRLSMEWASLPDPNNGGKSHYDGDSAGNHAGQTLETVYATLRHVRAIGSAPTPAQNPATPATDAPASPASPVPPVRVLQQALKDAGMYGGEVDGEWGPLSAAALLAFYHAG